MRGTMAGRKYSIKAKIFALLLVPLVSLVAIWGFAAAITVRSGQELLVVSSVHDHVTIPTRALTTALQHERLLSLTLLGDPASSRSALDTQRTRTNAAREELERLATEGRADIPDPLWQRVVRLLAATDRLTEARSGVDSRSSTRLDALDAYTSIIRLAFDVYEKMRISADIDLIDQVRAITLVGRSRELLSQQAALVSGVTGRIDAQERARFTELTTSRRMIYSIGFEQLDEEFQASYRRLAESSAFAAFERIEDAFPTAKRADISWATAAAALSDAFDRVAGDVSQRVADRAAPLATGVLVQIGVAGGLGLVAVAASIFVSVRFGRRIGAELVGLQRAALDLADRRLPSVVARLRRGEDVCAESESPELRHGTTAEVVSIGEAFSSVQRTAVEAAVGQAEMRKGVNKVFVNLARRSQSLLHRQLAMLEAMEKRATDPEILDDLFALDHLTTRMRRHSEGLIILSGSVPGRGWRTPVAIYDVVRAAVEEVEDYLRVTVAVPHGPALVGTVVTDVIHLVAELVENAAIFSPPGTTVRVHGETVAKGYAIEVEDRGLGMSPAEMAHFNARLADPPEFDLADSDRLGLFVVGRLAARHGIRVSLRPSPFGGITAIVLIPGELVAQTPEPHAPAALATEQPVTYSVEVERVPAADGLPKRVRGAVPEHAPRPVPGQAPAPVAETAPDRILGARAVPGEQDGPGGLPRRVRKAANGTGQNGAGHTTGTGQTANGTGHAADGAGHANGAGPAGDEPVVPSTVLTSFRAGWRRAEKEGDGV
ncbi:nitrate- and nitrite sensing domain-containing protein [Planomonospora sp. ID67723]|uniref:sensor histidine kinase n=1 Tax=Planomonospora sp. ID67723 TaxID=2738134 RepID=UPI0018C43246|nr:nitrate- and nitrite sensing domain-containing protein [Planomonospora sp. ID67723]MBG0827403.1 nitrate- and nitrite sensing domain-containing protein [Planomonospora sp. ID67723]